ncbi:nuclear transport factor 2 family protein [Chryseosolibacter indicus]|uniref:Nuclear transport factor 2 family protein n=1 Tax=Chryseosolibacter indicus TaxID=2782351 RepID=A0ABS5VL99_9BACT|nr:nuclear transport factor 2 family protein [Chryseosolibacter indicus]MBT1702212.1 nuclear transport factor 2 family protein [Chryseosolibacter indicus]
MTTQEIAERLAAYCRKGDWDGAQQELYDESAVSIEPYATPDFEKETMGLNAIHAKGKKFDEMIEQMHSIEVSQPLIAGNSIAFTLQMDVTMKGKGRMKAPELCVYVVRDGKIISEQFFV